MAKDYYETLGVGRNAGPEEIKRAYRELVLKYHPDINKDKKAEARMQEINEAYAVLGDEQKRRQYDSYGAAGFGQRFTEDDIFRGFNFDEIFKEMQGGFFGFQDLGAQFGNVQQQEQTGVNLYLSFDDLERGIDREFEVQRYKTCANCRGSGGEPGSKQSRCQVCNGTGRRHVQQNTPFGRLSVVTTCDRCQGRGKIFDRICRICNGDGKILVTERFRINAARSGGGGSGSQKRKFFF